jgi:hypothetical protein
MIYNWIDILETFKFSNNKSFACTGKYKRFCRVVAVPYLESPRFLLYKRAVRFPAFYKKMAFKAL